MLVLAMEFSKGAQRALLDTDHLQSDRWRGAKRTGERPSTTRGRNGIAWRVESPRVAQWTRTEGHSLKTE